jgi:hypothetical protein
VFGRRREAATLFEVDPAPDVYTVHRDGDHFTVAHYRSLNATGPCCVETVTIIERDHEDAAGADVAALTRANRAIERRHREQ